jgi:hypothetical protein
MPSPWQGAGYLANTLADAVAAKRADQVAGQRRQDLANVMSGIGAEGPTPQQLAQIAGADPELGKTYAQQAFQAREAAASRAEQEKMLELKGKQDEAYAAAQEGRLQARPSDLEKTAGRPLTPEESTAYVEKQIGPSSSDVAARSKQETAHVEAQSYVNTMQEAKDLVNTGVYNGKAAPYQGEYGKGVIGYATDLIGATDPETTKRDDRYNKIMNTAATAMTAAMKGSQSEKELALALDTARNPASTKEAKQQALDVIIRLGQAHAAISERAVKEMKGKPTYLEPYQPGSSLVLKPSGSASSSSSAPTAAAPAAGSAVKSPEASAALMEEARAAVAKGKNPDLVKKRLQEMGVDPKGL